MSVPGRSVAAAGGAVAKSAGWPASGLAAQHRNSCWRGEPRRATGGPLTLPRPSNAVRNRPSAQVDGLCLSAGVGPERQESERLAVNLAVSQLSTPDVAPVRYQACPSDGHGSGHDQENECDLDSPVPSTQLACRAIARFGIGSRRIRKAEPAVCARTRSIIEDVRPPTCEIV
jgi:hypothetical protein